MSKKETSSSSNRQQDMFLDDIVGIFDEEVESGNEAADEAVEATNSVTSFDLESEAASNRNTEKGQETVEMKKSLENAPADDLLTSNSISRTSIISATTNTSPNTERQSPLETPLPGEPQQRITKLLDGSKTESPSWYSEVADKPHRKAMKLEIELLLKQRKKSQPSKEWLRQLPIKATKLEERLYRTAQSLEAYLDRKTLKHRLKSLARIIMVQFKSVKEDKRRTSTSSTSTSSSRGSFASTFDNRDSFTSHTSVDSLRALQSLMSNNASLDSAEPLSQPEGSDAFNSSGHTVPKIIVGTAATEDRQPALGSQEEPVQSDTSQPSIPDLKIMSQGSLSELERQKAINERLQKQIEETIRQQEELARSLQKLPENSNIQTAATTDNRTASKLEEAKEPVPARPSVMPGASMQPTSAMPTPTNMVGVQGSNVAGLQIRGLNPNLLMAQAALLNNGLNTAGFQQQQAPNAQTGLMQGMQQSQLTGQASGIGGTMMSLAAANGMIGQAQGNTLSGLPPLQLAAICGNSAMLGTTNINSFQQHQQLQQLNQNVASTRSLNMASAGFNPNMPPPFSRAPLNGRNPGSMEGAFDKPESPESFHW